MGLLWASLEIQSAKLENGLASQWWHDLRALTIRSCVQYKRAIVSDVGGAHRGVGPIADEVLDVLRKWFELCYALQVTHGCRRARGTNHLSTNGRCRARRIAKWSR